MGTKGKSKRSAGNASRRGGKPSGPSQGGSSRTSGKPRTASSSRKPPAVRKASRGKRGSGNSPAASRGEVKGARPAGLALKGREKTKGSRVAGVFSHHERGFGFVCPDSANEPDLFIPPRMKGFALHGDRVEALVVGRGPHGRTFGEIVKILERDPGPVAGLFDGRMVIPRDRRIDTWIKIHPADRGDAEPGDVVMALIRKWPDGRRQRVAEGRIVENLGEDGAPGIESVVTLRAHGFSEDFPSEVMEEAASAPTRVRDQDRSGREDLTHVFTITIDPARARDFDDAIAIERQGRSYRLWVSIADVSHYVSSGSAIDQEAFERSTSVYLPDRAVPMLPPELSSNICSLVPGEERLAMTVEMTFDEKGKRTGSRFYTSVIKSDHRLTYDQVEEMEDDVESRNRFQGAWEAIETMRRLLELRRRRRRRRGAIDLDMAEAEVVLDDAGVVQDIRRRTQTWSHKLVEEFMLSANETVADFMTDANLPMVYRIHEPPAPAAVETLADALSPLGFHLLEKGSEPEHIKPKDYQRVIDKSAGSAYEMMVKMLCLRSMMQARYSADLRGHFGLASDRYCHFTSPIRRYPDLIVHRLLKQKLDLSSTHKRPAPAGLTPAAAHCSERERAAESVEREMVDLYRCRWMASRLGQNFDGMVSGVTGFGFFVELDAAFVEGLVPVESLGYDFVFDEEAMVIREGGHEYRIGDRVRVRALSVDPTRRRIEFLLLGKIGGQ